jgi:hypothetical protein
MDLIEADCSLPAAHQFAAEIATNGPTTIAGAKAILASLRVGIHTEPSAAHNTGKFKS